MELNQVPQEQFDGELHLLREMKDHLYQYVRDVIRHDRDGIRSTYRQLRQDLSGILQKEQVSQLRG